MRLRQCVLHPSLVLESLRKSDSNDVDKTLITKMVAQYNGPESKTMIESILNSNGKDESETMANQCVVCLDVSNRVGVDVVQERADLT